MGNLVLLLIPFVGLCISALADDDHDECHRNSDCIHHRCRAHQTHYCRHRRCHCKDVTTTTTATTTRIEVSSIPRTNVTTSLTTLGMTTTTTTNITTESTTEKGVSSIPHTNVTTSLTTTPGMTTTTTTNITTESTTEKGGIQCPTCNEALDCVWDQVCYPEEDCMIRHYPGTNFTTHCTRKEDCIFMKKYLTKGEIFCCGDRPCLYSYLGI